MSKVVTWLVTFQTEVKKNEPDLDFIFNSATNYGLTTRAVVNAARRIDPDSLVLDTHVNDHTKFFNQLVEAKENRDVEGFKRAASALMAWFRDIGPEAQEAINNRYVALDSEEKRLKLIFNWCYIFGSFVFAVSWWFTNADVFTKPQATSKRVSVA